MLLLAYAASGLCASVAAILYTGRLETGSPVLGQRILLDVIGATVIGGTSLYGGRGKVLWTCFGVLFFVLIDNSLNLLGRSHFEIMMIKGVVILAAASIDSLRNRLAPSS
jgi:ribose transport system permease protein